jgi:iron complex transport system permease protein
LKRKEKRWLAVLLLMTAALVVCVFWNLSAGSTKIGAGRILEILAGKEADSSEASVILKIRLPRIYCAMLAGGALSVSGYLLQTFFANPIAGPYILGISSGAKLFVAFVMIAFVARGAALSSSAQVLAAFAGALAAAGFVLLISARVKSMSVLVVCGIMIGYICSAVTDLLVTFADDSNIVNLHNWSQGSFSGLNMTDASLMAAFIVPALALALLLSKPIGAYRLGEVYAASLGVNVKALRATLILLSSLLTATATAFAGPISFVGIAVPHLMKNASSDTRPLSLIPVCFIGGAAVTLACDGLARTLFAPTEVAASSVSAVVLAPVVIVMMLRRKGARRD